MSKNCVGLRCLLLWGLLCGIPSLSQASVESARYLRNALHFYQAGRYAKAKGYFIALLSVGTAHEAALARRYLARAELSRPAPRARKVSTSPAPPVKKDELLEEPEEAPERTKKSSENAGTGTVLPQISGSLREEAAFRVYQPGQLSKLRTLGTLGGTGRYSDSISYKVSGRLWYDGVYDLTRHYPQAVADDQKVDVALRDAYADISREDWDVRVGKQQIVWGEAIGLFYADVVNAKDLREFVLPDFEFIRIPEWAMDAEYTKADFHAEGIWLPWPAMDKVGRPGSEFAFPLSLPPDTPVAFGPAQKPTDSIDNGEAGARLSYRANGWDLGVFHLRTWDKSPVYTRSLQPGLLTLTETHPRLTMEGATFAKEIHDVVLKGEFVYYWQKYFQSTDPSSVNGIVPKDYMDYLLGADYTFSNKVETTLQIGQRIIRDYESDLFQQKPLQTQLTLWLRRSFWENHLEPEVVVVRDLGTPDMMLRPKVSYKFLDHWKAAFGADFFDGPGDGQFGEFANRDRVYSEIQFTF